MLCVLCLIVLWGFSLVTSFSGVMKKKTATSNALHALEPLLLPLKYACLKLDLNSGRWELRCNWQMKLEELTTIG